MKNKRILYIEDEEDYQMLVQRILGHAGLEVTVADTGEAGLAALRRTRPDLLILDINLPDTDGYSLCGLLRQEPVWTDLPILMLTVRRRPEEWLRGFSSGANDYLSKPLNPPELIERVENCLSGKAQQFTRSGTPEYHLIQAAMGGNRAAFEVLIQKYKARLLDNVRQMVRTETEAEDLVSHTFLYAFERLNQFRGEATFYTWLYRIAFNQFTHINRRMSMASLEEISRGDETALPAGMSTKNDIPEELSDQESSTQLGAVLKEVPEPFRKMLELNFIQEMPYDAIAKKLDIPIGTVMSRLSRARKLLKDAWDAKTCSK